MERVYYIYCLINPINDGMFYIGVTSNPTKRFKDHLSHLKDNAKENKEKVGLINDILSNGKKPLFKILQCVYGTKLDAEKLETKHILEAKKDGCNIVNLTTVYNRSSDNGLQKTIIQFTKSGDFIKEFTGAREASRTTGITHGSISEVAKGSKIRKSAGGYLWRYKV